MRILCAVLEKLQRRQSQILRNQSTIEDLASSCILNGKSGGVDCVTIPSI